MGIKKFNCKIITDYGYSYWEKSVIKLKLLWPKMFCDIMIYILFIR